MEREHQTQLARWKAAKEAKSKPHGDAKGSSSKKTAKKKSPSDS